MGGTRDALAKDANTHHRSQNASQLGLICREACWDLLPGVEEVLLCMRYCGGSRRPGSLSVRGGAESREAWPAALRRAVRAAAAGAGGFRGGKGQRCSRGSGSPGRPG